MANIPAKVASRIAAGIKFFQPVILTAKSRDVNESDTVTIITDMLERILGYDKYTDVTSEHVIRGTYCDLAIKVDGDLSMLIEVKAINLELKDQFVKQAVDYAANQGVEWVILTNACIWRIYHVTFGKPIKSELILEFRLDELNPKNDEHIEMFWIIAKEGWKKARLDEFHARAQVISRFTIAALLRSESLLTQIRREMRKLADGIKVENDQILDILTQQVIKRDAMEGEKAAEAMKLMNKTSRKQKKEPKQSTPEETPETPDQF